MAGPRERTNRRSNAPAPDERAKRPSVSFLSTDLWSIDIPFLSSEAKSDVLIAIAIGKKIGTTHHDEQFLA